MRTELIQTTLIPLIEKSHTASFRVYETLPLLASILPVEK
jgi:hypothetical protein